MTAPPSTRPASSRRSSRRWDLERHGLEWLWPEVDLAHPLDDGRAGVLSRDFDRTLDSLGSDAAAWRRLFGPMTEHLDDIVAEIFRPVLHVPSHPITLTKFGIKALMPATWTARRWKDDPAQALYMGVAAHAFGRLDTPLSGSVGLMLAAAGHKAGWPVAKGGTQSISNAMISELESLGGVVKTGVTVASLDELGGPDIVMLDTAPDAVVRIVGERLPDRVRRQLTRYKYGPAVHKVDFAIDGDVPWTNADARVAGTLHLNGTAREIVAAEAATARGELPDRPFVLIGQQYLADPSRSQGSINPLWAYAHVPHNYQGDATEHVIGQIERFAPGFRDTIVATEHPQRAGDGGVQPELRRRRHRHRGQHRQADRTAAEVRPQPLHARRARASTCARRRLRPGPAYTGCAATTPRRPRWRGSSPLTMQLVIALSMQVVIVTGR